MVFRSHYQRTTALGVAVAALIGASLVPTSASAAGNTELKPTDLQRLTVPRAEAAKQVSDAEIRVVTEGIGVSESSARRSLALQRQNPNIHANLVAALGADFAQVTFDLRAEEFVILARNRTNAGGVSTEEILAARMRDLDLDDAYRFVAVSFNAVQLAAAQNDLDSRLASKVKPDLASTSLTTGRLEVIVRTKEAGTAAQEAGNAVTKASGVPIDVTVNPDVNPTPTLSCTHPNCDRLVGGIRLQIGYAPTGRSCTAGFYVGSSGTPNPLMLTAGHCTQGLNWQDAIVWSPTWTVIPFGHQIPYWTWGTGGDAGLVEDHLGRIPNGGYMNWSTNGYSQIEAYFVSAAATPLGYIVCRHGGRNTGYYVGDACGYVTSQSASVNYGGVVVPGLLGVGYGICVKSGDSGGPVTWAGDEVAVGVVSGGSNESNGTAPEDPDCSTTNYVEPIGRALSSLGIVLYGGPAT